MRPRRDAAQHGSRRLYQLGCRCFPCRLSDSRYHQMWRDGQGARRPVKVVLRHLDRLEASGWTRTQINDAANLGNSTLWHITSGRQRTVNSRTAAAILSLQPHPTTIDLLPLAAKVGRLHGVSGGRVLSRTDHVAATAARHELMWLLRHGGWSCAAVGDAMHRSIHTVSHTTRALEPHPKVPALVDLVPDPPELEQERDTAVDEAGCETCGDQPMGGGRWCYPCYLDHRSSVVAA